MKTIPLTVVVRWTLMLYLVYVMSKATSVQVDEDHTTSVPGEDHKTSVPGEDHKTSVPGEDHKTSVPGEDHKTSVPQQHTNSFDKQRLQIGDASNRKQFKKTLIMKHENADKKKMKQRSSTLPIANGLKSNLHSKILNALDKRIVVPDIKPNHPKSYSDNPYSNMQGYENVEKPWPLRTTLNRNANSKGSSNTFNANDLQSLRKRNDISSAKNGKNHIQGLSESFSAGVYQKRKSTTFSNVDHHVQEPYLVKVDELSTTDVFKCSATHCFCYYIHKEHYIGANCSSLKFKVIPTDLPNNTFSLNVADNKLSSLDFSDLLQYPNLNTFNAKGNSIGSLKEIGDVKKPVPLKVLILSYNKLKSLDKPIFGHFTSLETLLLSNNQITSVKNNTFVGLNRLLVLDLSSNKISSIESAVFNSVSNLQVLYLNNNMNLGYYTTKLPPKLFMTLKSLTRLYIQGSSNGDHKYPNEALSYLSNLTILGIDGLDDNVVLGKQVRQLKKLTSLQVGVGRRNKQICYFRNLTSIFLENTPYLTDLEFSRCLFRNITDDAFVNVPNLKRLSISYARNLGFAQGFASLKSLQNSSLISLKMIHLVKHAGLPCRYIKAEDSKYIKNMKLELLDLSNNQLAMIEGDFYIALPQTLKTLILRDNKFSVDTFKVKMVSMLENLEKLDLTSQNMGEIPKSPWSRQDYTDFDRHEFEPLGKLNDIAFQDGCMESQKPCALVEQSNTLHLNHTKETDLTTVKDLISHNTTFKYRNQRLKQPSSEQRSQFNSIPIPPKLKTIWAPNFIFFGEFFEFREIKGSLEEIDFSFSYLSSWGNTFLPHNVRNVSFVGNFCKYIRPNFFPKDNALQTLDISNNILGPFFSDDINGEIFRDLSKVNHLDISMNLIYKLPPHFFKGLSSLKVLILSDNKLQSLNISISHMENLEMVDASRNSIAWIERKTRDDLDSIALDHPISLDLRKNPLPCTCEGLDILSWLATSKIHLIGKDFLFCRMENNEIELIGNLTERLQSMKRKCSPLFNFILVTTSSLLLMLFIASSMIVYRCRWKIRYIHKVTMSKWFGFRPSYQTSNFRFDALILYEEEDRDFVLGTIFKELETVRGHKLCIPDRDFLAGTWETTNITCAIQSSTKTIPIISPSFLKGEYSEYGVQMALQETIFERRPVLHLFLYKDVKHKNLGKDLLVVLKDDRYIEYPNEDNEDVRINNNFWDSFSQVIGFTDNRSQPILDLSELI